MKTIIDYIYHPVGFAVIAAVLFLLAILANVLLKVPAEGIQRVYAFGPLALLFIVKGYTMTLK